MNEAILPTDRKFQAVVIGVSAGAMAILEKLIPLLPPTCPIPVIIVMHVGRYSLRETLNHLNEISQLPVVEADIDSQVKGGTIYFAPPDYHLMVEPECTFMLSMEDEVNYSRPSIDLLFESCARVYRNHLIGIILTGSNSDGTAGMKEIIQWGGIAIVQDPADAYAPEMPASVVKNVPQARIKSNEQLQLLFTNIENYSALGVATNEEESPRKKYNSK